jgi:hypothetical protein
MAKTPAPGDPLFGTRWVRVAEQDTPQGDVYLPANADIPLSRAPRTQLELRPDGSGTIFDPGEDDRPVGRAVSWRTRDDALVVERSGRPDLRIVSHAPDRLVVSRQGGGG